MYRILSSLSIVRVLLLLWGLAPYSVRRHSVRFHRNTVCPSNDYKRTLPTPPTSIYTLFIFSTLASTWTLSNRDWNCLRNPPWSLRERCISITSNCLNGRLFWHVRPFISWPSMRIFFTNFHSSYSSRVFIIHTVKKPVAWVRKQLPDSGKSQWLVYIVTSWLDHVTSVGYICSWVLEIFWLLAKRLRIVLYSYFIASK